MIGLETALALAIKELIETKILSWPQLAEKMCLNPARILGLNKGALSEGADADIVIVDPNKEWIFSEDQILSKSKNSPFLDGEFKGQVEYTILSGKIAYGIS